MDFDEDSSNTREASCTPPLPTTDLTPNEIMKFGPGGEDDLPTPERVASPETVPEAAADKPTVEEVAISTVSKQPESKDDQQQQQQQGVVTLEADKNGEPKISNEKDSATSNSPVSSSKGPKAEEEIGEKKSSRKPGDAAEEVKQTESEYLILDV